MARAAYVLSRNEKRRLHYHAIRAQQNDHREVVGVLLNDGTRGLELQFIPNRAGPGSWSIALDDIRAARSHACTLGRRVVGLFHTHPLTGAVLGTRDLKSTPVNWLHLVYDVCGREMKLWRVVRRNGKKAADLIPLSAENTMTHE
jgi:hypothetical protein